MRATLLLLPLTACAGGGDSPLPDARRADASVVDSPDAPPSITLSQTTSDAIEPGTAKACLSPSSGTSANNYYRVFDLATTGITSDLHVYKITFGVELCHELMTNAGVDIVARVGLYDGVPGATLSLASMTLLASANAHVPETSTGIMVDAPIEVTVPAGSQFFIELDSPEGANKHSLFIGANDDGETHPAYVLAPTQCSVTEPLDINMVANTPIHLVMTVSGTY